MQRPIEPIQAAVLARDVYLLSNEPSNDVALSKLKQSYKGLFEFTNNRVLAGKTGGPGFLKCRTAFGLCLIGQKQFEGHSFIVFRGTDFLADWLTNLNATLSRSSNNQPVHTGFSETFKSLRPQLVALMQHLSGTKIHCIGHSLGGAVASLCAEWIELAYNTKPCLYTFGAPPGGPAGICERAYPNAGIDKLLSGSPKLGYRASRTDLALYSRPVSGSNLSTPGHRCLALPKRP